MAEVSANLEDINKLSSAQDMETGPEINPENSAFTEPEYTAVLEESVAAVETIPATPSIEKPEERPSIAFSCPTVMAALMSPISVSRSLSHPPATPVIPGTKDSEGFLTPPPASTLLLRRTRTNSTGSSTYVIASSSASPSVPKPKPKVSVSGNGNVTALTHDAYAQARKSYMKRSSSSRDRDGNFIQGARSSKKPKLDGKLSNILSAPSTHHSSQSRNSSSGNSTVFVQQHHPHFRPSVISPLALNPPQSLSVTITPQRSVSTFSPTPPATSSQSAAFGFPVPIATDSEPPKPPVSRGKPAYITEIHPDLTGKGTKARSERVSDGNEVKRKCSRRKRFGWEKKGSKSRKRYYSESSNVYAPEHMGDWRPMDDLRLIVNVLQTKNLRTVYRGVRFSCKYELYNIRARWCALMYDPPTAKVSQAAIHKLHPKVVQEVYKKALFSKKEHALLKTIKSTHDLKCLLPKMEKLLHENPLTFLKWRTPKIMVDEWLLLKDCHLLCDQDVRKYFEQESFDQYETSIRRRGGRRPLARAQRRKRRRDGGLRRELKLDTRFARGKIRVLEEEVAHWQLVADMVTELDPNPFEEGSYAMLRGKQVRYLMRSREITLGRRSEFKTVPIDADLSLEGSTYKISRKQATIQLRSLGDFCIMNHGKHCFFVDGRIVMPGKMERLFDQSVIEISRLRFIFIVNNKVLNDYISKQIRIEVKREMGDLQKLARAIKSASAAASGAAGGGASPTSVAAAHIYALTTQSAVLDAVLASAGGFCFPSPKSEDDSNSSSAAGPSSSLYGVTSSMALALSNMISMTSSGAGYKPSLNTRPVSPVGPSFTPYSSSVGGSGSGLTRSSPTPSASSSSRSGSPAYSSSTSAESRSNSPIFKSPARPQDFNSVSPTCSPTSSNSKSKPSSSPFSIGSHFLTASSSSGSSPIPVSATSSFDSTLAVIEAVATGLSPLPPLPSPSPLTLALTRSSPIQSPIVRPYIQPIAYSGPGSSNQLRTMPIYPNPSPPPPMYVSQQPPHIRLTQASSENTIQGTVTTQVSQNSTQVQETPHFSQHSMHLMTPANISQNSAPVMPPTNISYTQNQMHLVTPPTSISHTQVHLITPPTSISHNQVHLITPPVSISQNAMHLISTGNVSQQQMHLMLPSTVSQQQQHHPHSIQLMPPGYSQSPNSMHLTAFQPGSMESRISSPVQFGDLTIRPGLPPPSQPQDPATGYK